MDVKDIAPDLLDTIFRHFEENLDKSKKASKLLKTIADGKGTYAHAGDYAQEVGQALADAFQQVLHGDVLPDGRMYWNIADRVVRPMLEEDHRLVSLAAAEVQKWLNESAGIGLKPQTVPVNTDRIDGILNRLSSAEQYDDVAWILDEPVKTFSRSVADETLRRNVEFHGKVGMRPRVIRRAESQCCKWCRALEGAYDYPDVPEDIYHRHENCRCTVEYNPGSGRRQNVWSKKWSEPADAVDQRKNFVGVELYKALRYKK